MCACLFGLGFGLIFKVLKNNDTESSHCEIWKLSRSERRGSHSETSQVKLRYQLKTRKLVFGVVSCISRCLPVHAFESLLLAWTRWLRPKCFLIAFPQVSWTWPVSSQHVETTAQQVWRYCTALWGRAGLGHRGDMLSLHPSVCRWFSSALLFSEQQIGREQGLSTLLGCPVRPRGHLMRCIVFSKFFSLLCFFFPFVFVSSDCYHWLWKNSCSKLSMQKQTPTAHRGNIPVWHPHHQAQMLWWSADVPQRSNLMRWSDRESAASSGKLFQWLVNCLNCSAPRTILCLCRNAFGFQPLDLNMPLRQIKEPHPITPISGWALVDHSQVTSSPSRGQTKWTECLWLPTIYQSTPILLASAGWNISSLLSVSSPADATGLMWLLMSCIVLKELLAGCWALAHCASQGQACPRVVWSSWSCFDVSVRVRWGVWRGMPWAQDQPAMTQRPMCLWLDTCLVNGKGKFWDR